MMRVLLIDDDDLFAEKCCTWLFAHRSDVVFCNNVEKAKIRLAEEHFEIAIIDLMLPPTFTTEGLELLRLMRSRFNSVEPLMITHKPQGTTEIVSDAMRAGAHYFLDKQSTFFYDKLEAIMHEILSSKRNHIFISHGHNDLLKLRLKDFLSNGLHRSPIILSEQPSQGLTIVEKLERVSEQCCFAIILMTNDDETKEGELRARQNVIHEIGFFQGKYGRNNVILLAERGMELFSNISGIIRIDFEKDHFEETFETLRLEIEAAFNAKA